MPKRTDLHKILVIGAGPIVIGQGCEFDYSGSQAVKALREEDFQVEMEARILNFGMANDMTSSNAELGIILREAKEYGFSDRQLAQMWKRPDSDIRRLRKAMDIAPTYS